MHRLFVAVDLPDELKREIAGISDRQLSGARWIPGAQLHLTLRFIGDADDMQFQEIKRGLESVREEPFTLNLKGVGHFPPGREPRVLWVGVEESDQLNSMQKSVEQQLVNIGIEADRRRFSPHITIARLRDTPHSRVASLEERHRQFSAGPFPVEEFYLYSSIISREGAIHRREAVYRLE